MKHDTNQRLYVYDEIKNTFIDCFNNNTALSENSCEIIENGYVLPLKKELNQDGIGYFSGGVTNSEGVFLKASSYIRESLIGSLIDGYDFDKKIAKFMKRYMEYYVQDSYNRILSIKNPYLAKRIKPFEKAYIPFKKRIKQFFKNWKN